MKKIITNKLQKLKFTDTKPSNKMSPERFKQIFLETVDNQLKKNDPPQTRETLERLIKEGYTEEDAKLIIGQCVASEMMKVVSTHTPFNEARFVACLNRLPQSPATEDFMANEN